jgi:hypothetical protein
MRPTVPRTGRALVGCLVASLTALAPAGPTALLDRGLGAPAALALTTAPTDPVAPHAVAVGAGGSILTSADGLTWTKRPGHTRRELKAVAHNPGKWIAVGAGGTILSSLNGTFWTRRASGTTGDLQDVAGNGSGWVAVGTGGTIVSSPDGVTWTARASGTTHDLHAVTGSGSGWVAVGGGGAIVSSATGETWQPRAANVPPTNYPDNSSLDDVASADGDATAVGWYSPIGRAYALLRRGPIAGDTAFVEATATWAGGGAWVGPVSTVAAGPQGWIANGYSPAIASPVMLTSADGLAWIIQATGVRLGAATWAGDRWMAVANHSTATGTTSSVVTSTDGLVWTTSLATTGQLDDLAYAA